MATACNTLENETINQIQVSDKLLTEKHVLNQKKNYNLNLISETETMDINLETAKKKFDETHLELSENLNVHYNSRPVHLDPASDLKLLCRLIATHEQNLKSKSSTRLYIADTVYAFQKKLCIDIGQHICCLVFQPESQIGSNKNITDSSYIESAKPEHQKLFSPSQLIFAFNWFSPTKPWDYLTLGYRLLCQPGSIDKDYGLCSEFSMEQAKRFLNKNEMLELFKRYNISEASDLQNTEIKQLTITGFSMGGTIAHAFSYLLKENLKLKQAVRCVSFGAPRPGNDKLTQWFQDTLTPDSMNIIVGTINNASKEDYFESLSNNQNFTFNTDPDMNNAAECKVKLSKTLQAKSKQAAINFVQDLDISYNLLSNKITFDPVTEAPSCSLGFDLHPKLFVIFQEIPGILFPIIQTQREKIKLLELKTKKNNNSNSDVHSFNALLGLVLRSSPFSPQKSLYFDRIHSILKYYEAMCSI